MAILENVKDKRVLDSFKLLYDSIALINSRFLILSIFEIIDSRFLRFRILDSWDSDTAPVSNLPITHSPFSLSVDIVVAGAGSTEIFLGRIITDLLFDMLELWNHDSFKQVDLFHSNILAVSFRLDKYFYSSTDLKIHFEALKELWNCTNKAKTTCRIIIDIIE